MKKAKLIAQVIAVAAIIGAIAWAMSESSLFGFHMQ
jgi:hypothetical protein